MKRAFVLFAVAILYCVPSLAQEPEPDPNLLWVSDPSWVDGFHRFLVHPNGNILAGIGSTEFELDGNTGLIIREFPYPAVFYDISPDGKYISALTDQRCVIDYETEEVIVRFTNSNTTPKFMPDSKTLIYDVLQEAGEDFNTKLATYNIETGGYRFSSNPLVQTSVWHINVSPNGRFVATGGKYIDINANEYTRLVLWDALTLTPIKILSENKGFREIRSIKFSPDSKLVGFQVYLDNLYIYKTDDYSLYKRYEGYVDVEHSVFGFCFFPNNLLGYGNSIGGGSTDPFYIKIEDLNTSKLLYNNRTLWSNGMEYNPLSKTWLVQSLSIYCYDFEKILSGASIEPEIPNPFSVDYVNNSLSIRNYTFVTNTINCTISDISGRVVRNLNLNTITNEIRIPLKLLSGTYFLHIKDGNKEYV
ncbi:MAG: T9SS type A sorting domain-containing protein, partial [Candidatus Kapabacteria bacterium]|nr:T9SS type A sorting domain-containing protein [Candidatus Kapabacteria bacterium]